MTTKEEFNMAYLVTFIREVNSRMARSAIVGDPPEVIAMWKNALDAAVALLDDDKQ